MNRQYSHVSAFLLLALLSVAPALVAAKVKIFILIGQSNMYGPGKVEHLYQLKDESDEYTPYFNTEESFASRSDVRISSNQVFGMQIDFPSTDLMVGAGMRYDNMFGPEIGFGWTVGDEYDEPILLIKCAFGGTHLGVEWRSPSAPSVEYCCDFRAAEYGSNWKLMNQMIGVLTSDLEKYVPGHGSDGYDIAGVLWMQGWNDAFNYPMRNDYEVNLSYFVQDLLDEFGPTVPILIAELGQEGEIPQQESVAIIRQSQIDVVNAFALPNVVFLPTSPYVVTTDPRFDGVHHYYGRADTMIQIGKAFGREIIRQAAIPPSTRPTPSPAILFAPPNSPYSGSCIALGVGCTLDAECCSQLCQRLVANSNSDNLPGSCRRNQTQKAAAKYGSGSGGGSGAGR